MTGNRLAHLSLRFDAVYCLALGLAIAATAPLTARGVELPASLLVGAGSATFLWGVYVWWASRQRPVRAHARVVMIANIAASLGLVATGLNAGTTILALAALALAIEVAAFAISQGVSLRLMKTAPLM